MEINTTKQTWVKPKIIAHELKLHSLLGENGWLNNNKGPLAGIVMPS